MRIIAKHLTADEARVLRNNTQKCHLCDGITETARILKEFALATRLAERVGFEPTCPLRDKTLSRRPRYDHFGTSPVVCVHCTPAE